MGGCPFYIKESDYMFDGRLLIVGDYRLPLKFIKLETYKATPNQRLDRDSYEDANGDLQRNALDKTRTKIEFETPPLHYLDKREFMANLREQFNKSQAEYNQRKVQLTYFNDETDEYDTAFFYIPDITWTYYNVDEENADITYMPTRIAFIEY